MADTLQQRLEAERRVTADIAHELRTPVTGLLTAAELLPPGPPHGAGPGPGEGHAHARRGRPGGGPARRGLRAGRVAGHHAGRVRGPAGGGEGPGGRAYGWCTSRRSRPTRAGWSACCSTCWPTRRGTASRRSRSPSRAGSSGSATTAPASPRTCSRTARAASAPAAATVPGHGHGLGLTIAAGQARVLGARLTFRNVRPPGAPDDVPAEGAVAVLWLPEHAPTNTGSYPMLPRCRAASGAIQPVRRLRTRPLRAVAGLGAQPPGRRVGRVGGGGGENKGRSPRGRHHPRTSNASPTPHHHVRPPQPQPP